ncbi:MAG: IS200/IS605 family transposase [Deltaproteobacteria bacterium]|jgi:putative transposase|nr:IS200/IS605 family transposase [Deltaproteobacteria bacterium]
MFVHIVWATRRREPLLEPVLDSRVCGILGRKALEVGCHVLAAGCASDHVHVLVRLKPTVPLSQLVQRLKGASAYELNQAGLARGGFAWQDGYWADSVSPTNIDAACGYVRSQRDHHGAPAPERQVAG